MIDVLDKDLVARVKEAEQKYILDRITYLRQYNNNQLGITIKTYEKAIAVAVKQWPQYWYGNLVLGIDKDHVKYLSDIDQFFSDQDLTYRIVLTPTQLSPPLGKALQKHGYFPAFSSAALYSLSPKEKELADSISIVKVRPEELPDFLDIYQEAFGYKKYNDTEKAAHTQWMVKSQNTDKLHLYQALVDNMVAGVAVMYINDKTAIMADAATLPNFRQRGVQQSLIAQRIKDAQIRQCDLFTSFVEYLSGSHRNLTRHGFQLVYTFSTWYKTT